jgi:predicted TIM-barrel fold metal-dependent hydrolase
VQSLQAGIPWSLADRRDVIRAVIDAVGPDRVMFAMNLPVDGLTGSFETTYAGFKAATADLAAGDRLKLFPDTAIRVYRRAIPPAAGGP